METLAFLNPFGSVALGYEIGNGLFANSPQSDAPPLDWITVILWIVVGIVVLAIAAKLGGDVVKGLGL